MLPQLFPLFKVPVIDFSSFEPDVVCSVFVIPLQHKSYSVLHVFRQIGPPQRVDCLV